MQRIELYSRIMEAVRLGEWVKGDDIQFCIEIAQVYGCEPLKTDIWNFYKFLFALYGYGKVQGKREERARRKRSISQKTGFYSRRSSLTARAT